MTRRSAVKLALFAGAALFVVSGSMLVRADDEGGQGNTESTNPCYVNVNTDKGNGGSQVKVCNDGHAEVGVGGPIKDVTWATPLGRGKAALPQAGRDGQAVVQRANQNVQGAMHALGFKHF